MLGFVNEASREAPGRWDRPARHGGRDARGSPPGRRPGRAGSSAGRPSTTVPRAACPTAVLQEPLELSAEGVPDGGRFVACSKALGGPRSALPGGRPRRQLGDRARPRHVGRDRSSELPTERTVPGKGVDPAIRVRTGLFPLAAGVTFGAGVAAGEPAARRTAAGGGPLPMPAVVLVGTVGSLRRATRGGAGDHREASRAFEQAADSPGVARPARRRAMARPTRTDRSARR